MVVVGLTLLVDDDKNRTPTLTTGLNRWLVGIILDHDDEDDDSRYADAEREDKNLGVCAFDANRENERVKGRL